jgi:uncharacterized membrane protein YkvA (DUF1232 family)
MKHPWRSWFRRDQKKAARLVRNPLAVLRVVDAAKDQAPRARGPLAEVWDDMQTAIRLTRAWARRDYPGVARSTIVLVVGGLLYFLSPIDAIIDAIPVLGFVDDALVLGWVVRQVRSDLEAFRDWERRNRLLSDGERATPALGAAPVGQP